jgi:hypothetical protein
MGMTNKLLIAVTVRRTLEAATVAAVEEAGALPLVLPEARSGDEWRYFLHQLQPDGGILDERAGNGRWKPIAAMPRSKRVRSGMALIGVFQGLAQTKKRLALFAGCDGAVDASAPSYADDVFDLVETLREIRASSPPTRSAEERARRLLKQLPLQKKKRARSSTSVRVPKESVEQHIVVEAEPIRRLA